jgi:hypothetical protein
MEQAAAKLKEFSDDYTLNTNKPMDLVFFKVSTIFIFLSEGRLMCVNAFVPRMRFSISAGSQDFYVRSL